MYSKKIKFDQIWSNLIKSCTPQKSIKKSIGKSIGPDHFCYQKMLQKNQNKGLSKNIVFFNKKDKNQYQ